MLGYDIVIKSQNQAELSIGKKEIMKVANSDCKISEFPGDISQDKDNCGFRCPNLYFYAPC
jgi:hypothetical protein